MHPILKRDVFRIMVDVNETEESIKTFANDLEKCAGNNKGRNVAEIEAHIKRLDMDLCILFSDTYFLGLRYWKDQNMDIIRRLHNAFSNLNRIFRDISSLKPVPGDGVNKVSGLEMLLAHWFQFKKSIIDMRRAMAPAKHRRKRVI